MEVIKDEIDPVLANYLKELDEKGIKYEVKAVPAVPMAKLED